MIHSSVILQLWFGTVYSNVLMTSLNSRSGSGLSQDSRITTNSYISGQETSFSWSSYQGSRSTGHRAGSGAVIHLETSTEVSRDSKLRHNSKVQLTHLFPIFFSKRTKTLLRRKLGDRMLRCTVCRSPRFEEDDYVPLIWVHRYLTLH